MPIFNVVDRLGKGSGGVLRLGVSDINPGLSFIRSFWDEANDLASKDGKTAWAEVYAGAYENKDARTTMAELVITEISEHHPIIAALLPVTTLSILDDQSHLMDYSLFLQTQDNWEFLPTSHATLLKLLRASSN